MKHTKRLLAGLTALVLALSLLPMPALAADAPPATYTQDGITATITQIPWYEAYQRSVDGAPAKYASVRYAGERMFLGITKDNTYHFLDINGNEVAKIDLSIASWGDVYFFHEGLCRVKYFDTSVFDSRWGFVDKTGKLVIGGLQGAKDFHDGRAAVIVDTYYWNIIDKTGKTILSRNLCDEIFSFNEGLALMTLPSTINPNEIPTLNQAFCDVNGSEVVTVPREMMRTYEFSDEMEPVDTYEFMSEQIHYGVTTVRKSSEGWEQLYLMDKSGTMTPLPSTIHSSTPVIPLGGNTFFISTGSMRGIMDTDGNILYPFCEYGKLDDVLGNGAFISGSYDTFGMITRKGSQLIPGQWQEIREDTWREADQGATIGIWKKDGYPNTAIYLIEVTEGGSAPTQPTNPTTPAQPTPTPAPETPKNLAYASTQTVTVDGKPVEFQMYALKDANGNDTNYVKLRDVAATLNGTPAQFEVSWDGAVNIVTGQPYTPNGSEMSTPFSGDRAYTVPASQTKVNGSPASLEAIVLTDGGGNGYTYYKLRDLGTALGFTVDWSAEQGVFIQTN